MSAILVLHSVRIRGIFSRKRLEHTIAGLISPSFAQIFGGLTLLDMIDRSTWTSRNCPSKSRIVLVAAFSLLIVSVVISTQVNINELVSLDGQLNWHLASEEMVGGMLIKERKWRGQLGKLWEYIGSCPRISVSDVLHCLQISDGATGEDPGVVIRPKTTAGTEVVVSPDEVFTSNINSSVVPHARRSTGSRNSTIKHNLYS